MINNNAKKLTFWGASPIIFIATILYTIPIIFTNHFLKPVFEISFIPNKILVTPAIVLLCFGIPIYITTLKKLKVAYKK